jgi:hypothetical protein
MKNLLNIAKANAKKIEATTKKEVANSLKEFKKIQAEQTKAKKSEKSIESDKIKLSWLNDTQSKTALENYVKNNTAKFEVFLNLTNELNSTSIKINQVNKQLFKFGYLHELNKLDFEGNILEAKSFFNIAFFVANGNSLLNRFAKYKNVSNANFIKASEISTDNYLDSKFKSLIKIVLSKGANQSEVTEILTNTEIGRNEKAEQLKALITE